MDDIKSTKPEPTCPCRECFNRHDDEVFEKPSKSWEQQYAEDVGQSAYGPI